MKPVDLLEARRLLAVTSPFVDAIASVPSFPEGSDNIVRPIVLDLGDRLALVTDVDQQHTNVDVVTLDGAVVSTSFASERVVNAWVGHDRNVIAMYAGPDIVEGPHQLARLTRDNALDPTFGTAGLAALPLGNVRLVLAANDGGAWVFQQVERADDGSTDAEETDDLRLLRLTGAGTVDANFNSGQPLTLRTDTLEVDSTPNMQMSTRVSFTPSDLIELGDGRVAVLIHRYDNIDSEGDVFTSDEAQLVLLDPAGAVLPESWTGTERLAMGLDETDAGEIIVDAQLPLPDEGSTRARYDDGGQTAGLIQRTTLSPDLSQARTIVQADAVGGGPTRNADGSYYFRSRLGVLSKLAPDLSIDRSFGFAGEVRFESGATGLGFAEFATLGGRPMFVGGGGPDEPITVQRVLPKLPYDPPAASAQVVRGALIVSGTPGDDFITLDQHVNDTTIDVRWNSLILGSFAFPGDFQFAVIDTGKGDDWIDVEPIIAVVLAGSGNDRVHVTSLQSTVFGGLGDDSILGSQFDDILDGGPGRDTMDGAAGDDTIYGGTQADQLLGGAGDDRLVGEGGNDYLFGMDGDDTLLGNNGRDTLTGGDDDDWLFGGATTRDKLDGGLGLDSGAWDRKDRIRRVEMLL